jgi:SAM-dependent methyltransferase
MLPTASEHLRCPRCHAPGAWELDVRAADDAEVREGALTCTACGRVAAIEAGIVDLLHDPPAAVLREAAGLERFAGTMRAEGWTRERVLALPYVEDGYWFAQAALLEQVLATVPFEAGQRLLDVGANTCWASAHFAERGLDVTALDITAAEWQGLRTGEWWFDAKGCRFDRVLGRMDDLPFADATFDWVWCCQVLHHNPPEQLARTLRELHRVLRPGGTLVVANEPLLTLRRPRVRVDDFAAQFEGDEHAYWRFQYRRAAERAGFDVEVRGPWYHAIFHVRGLEISTRMTTPQLLRAALSLSARRQHWARRPYLAWRSYVAGGTALHMLARKR